MKVLVYGGNGSQGGWVVRALLANGHTPCVLTRHPETARPLDGVQYVQGDVLDAASLHRASEGIDGVAFMVPFSLAEPWRALDVVDGALAAAKAGGVRLLTFNTSGPVLPRRIDNPAFDWRIDAIERVQASGVPAVVLQPTAYLENLLGPWTRGEVIEADVLAYPVPEFVPMGWLATTDLGTITAAALERPHLAGSQFFINGLHAVTGPELAAQMSEGLGRTITYRTMPLEEFGAKLDAVFPGSGEGAIATYRFQQQNPDLFEMWRDMTPVLEQLPVRMTGIAEWAAQVAPLFSPQRQGA
jgi:uncharacterized protein YbjT (DUF2867 family)